MLRTRARYNTQTQLLEGRPEQLNLVNLTLTITGPLRERTLCILLMLFQVPRLAPLPCACASACLTPFWVTQDLSGVQDAEEGQHERVEV